MTAGKKVRDYAGKPPSAAALRARTCGAESPALEPDGTTKANPRPRCNRLPHEPTEPHRNLDARTFAVLDEWTPGGLTWVVRRGEVLGR